MSTTPTIPDFVRNFRHPPYRNIYEICPEETYLFGTESLYGDWKNAELLILGQDAGPADEFQKLREAGHPRPFAHREFRPGYPGYDPSLGRGGAGTNETVYRLAEHVGCAKLYGSALIGLCKPGGAYGATLPEVTKVRPYCVRVLRWVLDPARMPNLRAVICLGRIADRFARRALREAPLLDGQVRIFSTPHPAARDHSGKYEAALPARRAMAAEMGWRFDEPPQIPG